MENKSMDLEATRSRLSTLKYSQLRKAAKRYSVNANQKKEVLIMELSKVWKGHECNKENIIPKKVAESEVALSPKSFLNDTLNQTFTVERSDDNSVELCNEKLIATTENLIEKKNISEHSEESNFVPSNASSFIRKVNRNISTLCKNRSATRGALVARFAALHQKLAEKQPTLQEADANVKRKFAEHERKVPDTFKRLATPKASKKAKPGMEAALKTTGYKFKNVSEDSSKMNFSFSKLYGTKNAFTTVQNYADVDSQSQIPLSRKQRMPEVGVKELTKKLNTKQVRHSSRLNKLSRHTNSTSIPQLNTRLRRLATPKGKNPELLLTESEEKTLRRYGRRYVPYRRMIPYVDTTRMTDNQFQEAKMLGKIQTITAVSSRTERRQQLHLKRDQARQRILKAKRGC
ncbi:unnamed protein product [Cercopithifilaria johnstoni]|uniref:Uncharacterized protein n=1 Tax=Cercopithifilaria johnstoni TaxID=2874296 RepID=A0A8J2PPC3_9BILA|nr:unnamed protein product [Cercopithifilaria johnstoni]